LYFLIIIIILYLWTEFSLLEVRPNQDGGALRASMGHPKPFDLRIVTIGNEDCGKFNYKGMFLLVFYIYFLACWVSYHISFILIGIQFCFSRNLKFYGAIERVYSDIQIISNCDGSEKSLDHPTDLYDFHVMSQDIILEFLLYISLEFLFHISLQIPKMLIFLF